MVHILYILYIWGIYIDHHPSPTFRGEEGGSSRYSSVVSGERKVGFKSPQDPGRTFFSWVNFLCWLLFGITLPPLCYSKRSQSFCQKWGWQVTAEQHTPYNVALHEAMWGGAWLYGVHRTCRNGSSFTWHQPCNNRKVLQVHHSGRYTKCSFSIMRWKCSESAWKWRIILYKSNHQSINDLISLSTW